MMNWIHEGLLWDSADYVILDCLSHGRIETTDWGRQLSKYRPAVMKAYEEKLAKIKDRRGVNIIYLEYYSVSAAIILIDEKITGPAAYYDALQTIIRSTKKDRYSTPMLGHRFGLWGEVYSQMKASFDKTVFDIYLKGI